MSVRSTISIVVNGSKRRIVCEKGQEEHLQHAGRYLDRRVREMKNNVGAIADSELLVLTALMLVDDLSEGQERISSLKKTLRAYEMEKTEDKTSDTRREPVISPNDPRLGPIAARIEHLAKLFADN